MAFNITSAKFTWAASSLEGCPEPGLPEFAFIGRSNVGKSSLINALTKTHNLAHTSSSPGKTQGFNFFEISTSKGAQCYFVDLPGYGFASRSKEMRAKWGKATMEYFETRPSLVQVLQLVDSSITPQASDLAFAQKLGEAGIPFVTIFTKTDKEEIVTIESNIAAYKTLMMEVWEALPPQVLCSAHSTKGIEGVLALLDDGIKEYKAAGREAQLKPGY